MSKTVSVEEIYALFPAQLTQDSDGLRALATVAALELARLWRQGDLAGIYTRIDELDEAALDLLAADFKIDWWDKTGSIDKKRETLKNCWAVHKRLGTKAAIVTAIKSVAENAELTEWFEYGGRPYHFRLTVDTDGAASLDRILDRIEIYKNVRSVFDAVTINAALPAAVRAAAAAQDGTDYIMQIRR